MMSLPIISTFFLALFLPRTLPSLPGFLCVESLNWALRTRFNFRFLWEVVIKINMCVCVIPTLLGRQGDSVTESHAIKPQGCSNSSTNTDDYFRSFVSQFMVRGWPPDQSTDKVLGCSSLLHNPNQKSIAVHCLTIQFVNKQNRV